ncbi:MAG: D-alanyl-D-alanine carboxypeptidase family protein [Gammaproteobacteria bacterium]|nr:D-alanyl-D-alanine carboxypeptidase family protein [Gammaproteobacteria bacterium]
MTAILTPRRLLSTFVTGLLLASLPLQAGTPLPAPPQIAGDSHILVDHQTGKVLVERNADNQVEPASITKIMTAYVVFKQLEGGTLSLDDEVLVSEKAWRAPGSRMFIEVDKKIPVEDLLKGMIIQSGNDASIALAEFVAGSEDSFADLMNQYAAQLGMSNSNFRNATGLPSDGHLVTARDIAILVRAMIAEFPEYYRWYSQREYTWNEITQGNRNLLLYRDDRVDGVKTGHTDAAGYCLAASAVQDDMRLISVVMGTGSEKSRADASQALLNYGFRFFETHKLYAAGDAITEARVWKGPLDTIGLMPQQDIFITIPRGRYDELEAVMDLKSQLMAPLAAGEIVGVVRISLDGEELVTAPLVPAAPVPEGSLFRVIVDSVKLLFE